MGRPSLNELSIVRGAHALRHAQFEQRKRCERPISCRPLARYSAARRACAPFGIAAGARLARWPRRVSLSRSHIIVCLAIRRPGPLSQSYLAVVPRIVPWIVPVEPWLRLVLVRVVPHHLIIVLQLRLLLLVGDRGLLLGQLRGAALVLCLHLNVVVAGGDVVLGGEVVDGRGVDTGGRNTSHHLVRGVVRGGLKGELVHSLAHEGGVGDHGLKHLALGLVGRELLVLSGRVDYGSGLLRLLDLSSRPLSAFLRHAVHEGGERALAGLGLVGHAVLLSEALLFEEEAERLRRG